MFKEDKTDTAVSFHNCALSHAFKCMTKPHEVNQEATHLLNFEQCRLWNVT